MLSIIHRPPVAWSPMSSSLNSPLASRVNRSMPTARTSGSANGSLIKGFSALLANARAVAIIVAVAPHAGGQIPSVIVGTRHPSAPAKVLLINSLTSDLQ